MWENFKTKQKKSHHNPSIPIRSSPNYNKTKIDQCVIIPPQIEINYIHELPPLDTYIICIGQYAF